MNKPELIKEVFIVAGALTFLALSTFFITYFMSELYHDVLFAMSVLFGISIIVGRVRRHKGLN